MQAIISRDYAAWTAQARNLLRIGISPNQITWMDPMGTGDLLYLAHSSEPDVAPAQETPAIMVPKAFRELAAGIYPHRSPDRAYLLYELLWRITHGERNLLERLTDPVVHQLYQMRKQISRDLHKMKAFVRFRLIQKDGQDWYVAWHQPDHRILRAVSPFFRDRFNNMNWSIFTPDESVHWNQSSLTFDAGCLKNPVDNDDVESLWLTYYRSIFNPSRLNVTMMKSEMPVRFWATLPEAALIPELVQSSNTRTQTMITQPGAATRGYIPADPTIESLRAAAQNCQACPLWQGNHHAVLSEGPSDSALVLVGEQPGDEEDLSGRPFVGPTGQVLDALLRESGIDRKFVYITEAVKHFNHETRYGRRLHKKPRGGHIADCRPWLLTELAIIKPRVVVCLGVTAAQSVMGKQVILKEVRGQWFSGPAGSKVIITYHPSAILRQKSDEEKQATHTTIVQDLRAANAMLAATV